MDPVANRKNELYFLMIAHKDFVLAKFALEQLSQVPIIEFYGGNLAQTLHTAFVISYCRPLALNGKGRILKKKYYAFGGNQKMRKLHELIVKEQRNNFSAHSDLDQAIIRLKPIGWDVSMDIIQKRDIGLLIEMVNNIDALVVAEVENMLPEFVTAEERAKGQFEFKSSSVNKSKEPFLPSIRIFRPENPEPSTT